MAKKAKASTSDAPTETDIPVVPVMEVIETADDSAPPAPTTGGFTPVPAPSPYASGVSDKDKANNYRGVYAALPEHSKWFANIIIKHGKGSQQDVQTMHKIYEDLFLGIQTILTIDEEEVSRNKAETAMNDFMTYVRAGNDYGLVSDNNYRYRGRFGKGKLTDAQELALTNVLDWVGGDDYKKDEILAPGVWSDVAFSTLNKMLTPPPPVD